MSTDTARTAVSGANRKLIRPERGSTSRDGSRVCSDGSETAAATRRAIYERLSLNALLLITRLRDLDVPDGAQRDDLIECLRTHDEQAVNTGRKTLRSTAARRLRSA